MRHSALSWGAESTEGKVAEVRRACGAGSEGEVERGGS